MWHMDVDLSSSSVLYTLHTALDKFGNDVHFKYLVYNTGAFHRGSRNRQVGWPWIVQTLGRTIESKYQLSGSMCFRIFRMCYIGSRFLVQLLISYRLERWTELVARGIQNLMDVHGIYCEYHDDFIIWMSQQHPMRLLFCVLEMFNANSRAT